MAADVEAQTGAGRVAGILLLDPIKLLEDPLMKVGGNASPRVCHRHLGVHAGAHGDEDGWASHAVSVGVVDQVVEDSPQLLGVSIDPHRLGGKFSGAVLGVSLAFAMLSYYLVERRLRAPRKETLV